jgi:hypothetical protein
VQIGEEDEIVCKCKMYNRRGKSKEKGNKITQKQRNENGIAQPIRPELAQESV